jgi:hypothetical protein
LIICVEDLHRKEEGTEIGRNGEVQRKKRGQEARETKEAEMNKEERTVPRAW